MRAVVLSVTFFRSVSLGCNKSACSVPVSFPCAVICQRIRISPAWKHFSRSEASPSEQLYADYSFRQQSWPAIRQLTALALSNPPHLRLSRLMLTKLAFRFLLLCSAFFDVFLLIRCSYFSRQCRSRFRLFRRSGLREMHPSRQR